MSRSVALRGPTAPAESPEGDSRGRELRRKLGPESVPGHRTPHSPWLRLGSPASTESAVHPSQKAAATHSTPLPESDADTASRDRPSGRGRPKKHGSGGRSLGRKIVVKGDSRAGGEGRSGSGQMENTTSDWLLGGTVASLRGSKVGLVSVSPFAPETRVFGNSLREGCWYARA